jgi:glycosyltransferase involved in cell wall biosynthesis
MGTAHLSHDQEIGADTAVNLLFMCDFPPSNLAGGPILISRLLAGYPVSRILVLTASRFFRLSPLEGRLGCEHFIFPTTKGYGKWGLGRVKNLVDWLLVFVLVFKTANIIKRRRIEAVLSVAHGRFFLAAAWASCLSGVPLVLIVHDDWMTPVKRSSPLLARVLRRLSRTAVNSAAHIYTVSPEMQELLKKEFNADSEVQLVATERHPSEIPRSANRSRSRFIVYAGQITDAVEDNLKMLAKAVCDGRLDKVGAFEVHFWLYTKISEEKICDWGWQHPRINIRGWVSQTELPSALADADLLFLPFSFSESARYAVERAFPSKTADYLASGTPILVFGPPYSSLVRYAQQEGFAEVVDKCDEDLLARGIQHILSELDYRSELCNRSLAVFEQNHDIVRQRKYFRLLLSRIAVSRERT